MLRRAGFEKKNVTVGSDAAGALAGGLRSGFGLLLIAGTGSICYGRGPSGEICRAGGWGHILETRGSGYDAACRILRAVARARDGRGSATILDEMVMEYWSLDGMDALMDCVYRSGKGKTEIAALAILLDLAYKEGDTVAAGIMEDCAQGLAELVAAAARSFQKLYGEGGAIPCACSGGMLENPPIFRHACGKFWRKGFRMFPCSTRAQRGLGVCKSSVGVVKKLRMKFRRSLWQKYLQS